MRFHTVIQAVLLYYSTIAFAAQLIVTIPASALLANPATLPSSTHATLLGAPGTRHDARLTRSNTLEFKSLAPGSYLLNIYTRDYFFPPFRVDVSVAQAGADDNVAEELVQVWQTFRGNEWSNKGSRLGEGKRVLNVALQPSSKKDFYQQRGGFNIIGFLKSPMILMAIVSGGMVFGMPYLMDNMDPETKAEFEDMQKKSPITGSDSAASQLQNFDLAGWMAGKSTGSDTPKEAASGGNSLR